MKRLLAACAILALLFAFSIYTGHWVEQMAGDYIQALTSAQEMARRDDWEQAREVTRAVFQDWEHRSSRLHALLRHSDTDQVLISFHAVQEYLRQEEMGQYAAANAILIAQLELLAGMEQPSFENVF